MVADGEEIQLSTNRTVPGLLRRLAAVTGVLTMLVVVVPPTAGANPAGGAVLTAPTLSLTDLGTSNTLTFYSQSSTANVVFPVPVGLIPTSLNVTVNFPFNLRSGTLAVMQGDRVISKLGLPLVDMAPLVIPLPGVAVIDDAVSLTLKLSSMADDRYCIDWNNPVEFINTTVTFAGTELAPTTIADFLPRVLRKVTIAVPANPTPAESDTAVQLAASLTSRYRSQAPQISVVPLPNGVTALDFPSFPMERQIIIKEGPDAGLSLTGGPGVPQLLVSGPPGKLDDQARFLTDGSIKLAVTTKAVAGKMHVPAPLPGDSTTLRQLGQGNLTGVGVAPQVSIDLNQTKFGHSTQGYRLHLLGSFTPIPNELSAQVTASANGQVFDRWPAEKEGVIDRWVNVPDDLVDRYTSLAITVDTAGPTGACEDYRPISLAIDGSTVVVSTPSLPPIPAGFRSLPQALMPEVQVGIGQNSFADTMRAAHIVVGMQRLSGVPLATKVTTVEQAMGTRQSAIIISPDGWNDKSIALPVSADDRTITVQGLNPNDEAETVTLDPGARFGSLQTVFDSQRTLVVATSTGAPGQLDDLLRWLDNDPRRWSQLRSNALVAFPGRAPVSVTGRTPVSVYGPGSPSDQTQASEGGYHRTKAWFVAGALVSAAALGALAIALSVRREAARKSTPDKS